VGSLLSRRTRRVIVAVATSLLFIILAGVTYQSVSNAVERRRFPHPGRLVDVGGHQLHLYCTGEGRPTVILEAPAGGISMHWAWVQNDLKSVVRVCSYDRSGLGWSEAPDSRYDAARVPDELHALLQQAGERGPFILAGQELGAAFARLFAARYPREVVAVVAVDDLSETSVSTAPVRMANAWPWLARIGLLRASRTLSTRANGLPPPANRAAQAFLNRPDHLTRTAHEIDSLRQVMPLAATASIDPAIAVTTVSTREDRPPIVLASSEQARAVTRALLDAVERARRR
jgi:pimeloyl-ACP methyl ester carboxylesterase